MLKIFSRNEVFPQKYSSTTPALLRIKLSQQDFRTKVITTNTSLAIGLQVPNRLNYVTRYFKHI